MISNLEKKFLGSIMAMRSFTPSEISRHTSITLNVTQGLMETYKEFISQGAMGDREQHYFVGSAAREKISLMLGETKALPEFDQLVAERLHRLAEMSHRRRAITRNAGRVSSQTLHSIIDI